MPTIIGITAFLLASFERFSRLRFRPSPLFRRYFASDTFYLLTGFVAGGSLVVADVASGSQWVGDWGISRLASANLPLWATTLSAACTMRAISRRTGSSASLSCTSSAKEQRPPFDPAAGFQKDVTRKPLPN